MSAASGASPEEKLVASLITLMEAGTAPWRRPWQATGGGHHVNLLSGRRYRGSNPVLLTLGLHLRAAEAAARSGDAGSERADLPYWCGFAEARAHGIFPRRGSQAVRVLRPQRCRRPDSGEPEEEGEGASPDGGPGVRSASGPGTSWIRYRPMAVFHVSDLEGKALMGLIEARMAAEGRRLRREPERLAAAEALLHAWPVPVHHGGDEACYLPAVDRIQLPPRSAFASPAALYATWAHEAIHSTGHPSRLNRDLSGRMGDSGVSGQAYAREELVAELGAVLLGDRLEIGSDVRHHAAYLSHWVSLLRTSPRLLFQVLGDARQAAERIAPEAPEPPGPTEGEAAAPAAPMGSARRVEP